MSQPSSEQLQRAYELIQSDEIAEAHGILTRHLASYRDDVDAWWLMVYATEDQHEAERALRNVLRLDPSHEQARALLDEIGGVAEPEMAEAVIQDPSFLAGLDSTMPQVSTSTRVASKTLDDEFDFDDEADVEPLTKPVRSSRRLLTALLAALALILVVGALLILGTQRGSTPEVIQSPTSGAGTVMQPTTDPTMSVETTQTAIPSDVTSDNTPLSAEQAQPFIAELSGVTLISNGLEIINSSKGRTFSASVCSTPSSRAIRDTTFEAMKGLARANTAAVEFADAIAVKVFNCAGDNALLRFITADLMSAKEYADGVIDEAQFASLWSAEQ